MYWGVKLVRKCLHGHTSFPSVFLLSAKRSHLCRVQAEIASAIVGEVHPAIAIFVPCPAALKNALAPHWVMRTTPPDEHVLVTGLPVHDIYHIVTGVCVATTSSGVVFDTLEEGAVVGHLDGILGSLCAADIVSRTYCSMFGLPVDTLWRVLSVRLHFFPAVIRPPLSDCSSGEAVQLVACRSFPRRARR